MSALAPSAQGALPLLDALRLVPPPVARAHGVVPLRRAASGRLVAAAAEPDAPRLRAALVRLGQPDAEVERWRADDLRELLGRRYGAAAELFELAEHLGERPPEDAAAPALADGGADAGAVPAVRFVEALLRAAEDEGATDIHLDAGGGTPRVRFRIDGVLTERPAPPGWLLPRVVGRVRALAELELGEMLRPQDGAFTWEGPRRRVDVRVSIVPAERGPAVVLRLLADEASLPDLAQLGLPADLRRLVAHVAGAPDGLIVVAGPTGAGKTTTLHALLSLETGARNVVSIEDPVEIRRSAVRQVPVRRQVGLDFAGALRALLRQDPDVILVGETRDRETAALVVQAAVAGHLVLTTVHASNALAAFDRLLQLGADRALLADSARLVLSQRLVRRVCRACAGAGCLACEGAGLQGRVGVFEALPLAPPIRARLAAGATSEAVAAAARGAGYRTFAEEAARLLREGTTTAAELRRVLGWEEE